MPGQCIVAAPQKLQVATQLLFAYQSCSHGLRWFCSSGSWKLVPHIQLPGYQVALHAFHCLVSRTSARAAARLQQAQCSVVRVCGAGACMAWRMAFTEHLSLNIGSSVISSQGENNVVCVACCCFAGPLESTLRYLPPVSKSDALCTASSVLHRQEYGCHACRSRDSLHCDIHACLSCMVANADQLWGSVPEFICTRCVYS